MQPFLAKHRSRGTNPKISWMHHLLIQLIWRKSGEDYEKLSRDLGIPKSTFSEEIKHF